MQVGETAHVGKNIVVHKFFDLAVGEVVAGIQKPDTWCDIKDWIPNAFFFEYVAGAASGMVISCILLIDDETTEYLFHGPLAAKSFTPDIGSSDLNASWSFGFTTSDDLAMWGRATHMKLQYTGAGTLTTTSLKLGITGHASRL